jgi:3-oxoacyl-[acyl-carrier-protein] synthase II
MGTPVVITGWTAVSPFGLGRQSFSDGLREGRSTVVEHVVEGSPDKQACLVPGLDPAKILNGKGIRHLDRGSQLALATLGELVDPETDTGLRAGLVIGTTAGSVQSEMDHIRLSLTMPRPHFLEPKTIASGTMNCATAQCAIRFGITGPNTTLAGGRGAALHALNYAHRLLTLDRADSVIVGAIEEWTTARAWVTHHAGHREGKPLGEGCAAFRVEPAATAKRPVLAEVLGFGSRVALEPGDTAATMTECALGVLKHADVKSWDVWAVLGPVGTDVGIPDGLFGNAIADVPDFEVMGDTGAVSAAFAVVAALDVLRSLPDADGKVVLVVASDPGGVVACALLRLVTNRDETRKDDDE